MHRVDNSKFLLYIEPKIEDKSEQPENDEIAMVLRLALADAKKGSANYTDLDDLHGKFTEGSGYKGWHTCCDGTKSSNWDYQLKNGMITNSLCVHYVMWFRKAIPQEDWLKIEKIQQLYGRVQSQNQKRLM